MEQQTLQRQVNDEMFSCRQKKCRRQYRKLLILVLSIIILPPLVLVAAAALCFPPLTAFIGADSLAQIAPLLPQTPLILRSAAIVYVVLMVGAVIRGWLCRRNKQHKNQKIRLGYILAAALTLLALVLVRTEWAASGALLGSILLLVLIPILCFVLLPALSWFFKPLADAIFFLFSERKRLLANDGVWAAEESSLMILNMLCCKTGALGMFYIFSTLAFAVLAVPLFVFRSLQVMMCSIG